MVTSVYVPTHYSKVYYRGGLPGRQKIYCVLEKKRKLSRHQYQIWDKETKKPHLTTLHQFLQIIKQEN